MMGSMPRFGRVRAGRGLTHVLSIAACFILIGTEPLSPQEASSCGGSDWFAVQQSQRAGRSLSPICKAELDAAEDHREAAQAELNAAIQRSPESADAYAAHSTLAHFYLRIGRFHDANGEILEMLAARPKAPDLQNVRSLFSLLASVPDLAIVAVRPGTVRTHVIDGNVFAPVTVNGFARAYMLDTGLSLSMMSESEAKSLGLTTQTSTTAVSDISGLSGPGAKIVQVDRLSVGGTELRHIPFLVVSDANGAFVGIPPGQHGVLGIQPLLALGTLEFRKDGTLTIGGRTEAGHTGEPMLFDGSMPLSQIVYRGRPLPVTFDVGATQTTLNPPFAKLFPDVVEEGKRTSHTLNGISGTTEQRSVVLPHLKLIFGREVDLSPATILLGETTGTSSYAAANLGYDLMQQAMPFTIDFRDMRITFPGR